MTYGDDRLLCIIIPVRTTSNNIPHSERRKLNTLLKNNEKEREKLRLRNKLWLYPNGHNDSSKRTNSSQTPV